MQFNVMLIKNVAPRAVAERGGFFRRTDDVGGQADRAGDRSVMSAQLKQLHGAQFGFYLPGHCRGLVSAQVIFMGIAPK